MRSATETPCLLAALGSRLGFVEVSASRKGTIEEKRFRRFGLIIRQRRVIEEAQLEAPPVNGDGRTNSNGLATLALHLVQDAGPRADTEENDTSSPEPEVAGGEDDEWGPIPALRALSGGDPAESPARTTVSEALLTSLVDSPLPEPAPVEPVRHACLSGKTIGVVGFSEAESARFGRALADQYCSFLLLSHTDAEFRKGSTGCCDALIVAAPPDWENTGTLRPTSLLRTKKPALIIADRESLTSLGVHTHNGPREFLPLPWTMEETLWRAAMLLGRVPQQKAHQRKNGLKRVVIADESAARTVVHAVLAQEGMECHVADNGVAAIALARARRADAIIADVDLAGLDGFQLLAEVRRDPDLQNTAVILLTARQAEADVLRGFGLGADDYVTKPFSPMELAVRLKRSLARRS
jgi:CheY-like chemotaxis protein